MLSKVNLWQTDRQTESTEIINHAASLKVNEFCARGSFYKN